MFKIILLNSLRSPTAGYKNYICFHTHLKFLNWSLLNSKVSDSFLSVNISRLVDLQIDYHSRKNVFLSHFPQITNVFHWLICKLKGPLKKTLGEYTQILVRGISFPSLPFSELQPWMRSSDAFFFFLSLSRDFSLSFFVLSLLFCFSLSLYFILFTLSKVGLKPLIYMQFTFMSRIWSDTN